MYISWQCAVHKFTKLQLHNVHNQSFFFLNGDRFEYEALLSPEHCCASVSAVATVTARGRHGCACPFAGAAACCGLVVALWGLPKVSTRAAGMLEWVGSNDCDMLLYKYEVGALNVVPLNSALTERMHGMPCIATVSQGSQTEFPPPHWGGYVLPRAPCCHHRSCLNGCNILLQLLFLPLVQALLQVLSARHGKYSGIKVTKRSEGSWVSTHSQTCFLQQWQWLLIALGESDNMNEKAGGSNSCRSNRGFFPWSRCWGVHSAEGLEEETASNCPHFNNESRSQSCERKELTVHRHRKLFPQMAVGQIISTFYRVYQSCRPKLEGTSNCILNRYENCRCGEILKTAALGGSNCNLGVWQACS